MTFQTFMIYLFVSSKESKCYYVSCVITATQIMLQLIICNLFINPTDNAAGFYV